MTSATSMTSERGKGMFLKIIFLKSVHSSKKDELCPGFEVKILTKSVDRGGVYCSPMEMRKSRKKDFPN